MFQLSLANKPLPKPLLLKFGPPPLIKTLKSVLLYLTTFYFQIHNKIFIFQKRIIWKQDFDFFLKEDFDLFNLYIKRINGD